MERRNGKILSPVLDRFRERNGKLLRGRLELLQFGDHVIGEVVNSDVGGGDRESGDISNRLGGIRRVVT